MTPYQHTQRGAWLWWFFGAFSAVQLIVAIAVGELISWLVLGAVVIVLLVIAWLFSSLTVTVDDQALRWHFGPGFWRKEIPRAEITDVSATRTRWFDGWGIRITRRGMLYNVSGLDAVAVTRSSGKTTLIGTDDPNTLVAALRS